MAATSGPSDPNTHLYQLSPDQQDLLLAALTSNSSSSPMFNTPTLSQLSRHNLNQSQQPRSQPPPPLPQHQPQHQASMDMIRPAQEPSPPLSADLDGFGGTPIIGALDGFPEWGEDVDGVDGGWEFDYSDPSLLNGGTAPIENGQQLTGTPEKRKQPGDEGEEQTESEAKRRGVCSIEPIPLVIRARSPPAVSVVSDCR